MRRKCAILPEFIPDQDGYFEYADYIGVRTPRPDRPLAYIRLYPHDFIVEETWGNGTACSVDPGDSTISLQETPQRYLTCDLVKVNLSTEEAEAALREALSLSKESIHHAGRKDKSALTSQRISILYPSGTQSPPPLLPQIHLKNFKWTNSPLSVGENTGNNFVVLLRVPPAINREQIEDHLIQLQLGIPNYYGEQRFGSRFSVHYFGREVLRKSHKKAALAFLSDTTTWDGAKSSAIRERASATLNMSEVEQVLRDHESRFKYELIVARHLVQEPSDFNGALKAIRDQVKDWVFAYGSLLFNQILAKMTPNDRLQCESLPILLSDSDEAKALYAPYLRRDGVTDIDGALQHFGLRRKKFDKIPTTVVPIVRHVLWGEGSVLLDFSLPTGSFATTLLAHLFRLQTRQFAVPPKDNSDIDTLALISKRSVEPIRRKLGVSYFVQSQTAS